MMRKIIAKLLYKIERHKFNKALDLMVKSDVSQWPQILKRRNYGLSEEEIQDIWQKAEEFAKSVGEPELFMWYKYSTAFAMILVKKMMPQIKRQEL